MGGDVAALPQAEFREAGDASVLDPVALGSAAVARRPEMVGAGSIRGWLPPRSWGGPLWWAALAG